MGESKSSGIVLELDDPRNETEVGSSYCPFLMNYEEERTFVRTFEHMERTRYVYIYI